MKISMIVSGDPRYDGRVHREAKTLATAYQTPISVNCLIGNRLPSIAERASWLILATYEILKQSPDVVHCHDLDTLPAGVVVKKLTGAKLVYDCHEIYHDMVLDGHGNLTSSLFRKVEPRLARFADQIITANEGIQAYLRDLGFVSSVVRNYQPFQPYGARYQDRPFTVTYIGLIQPGRFISRAMTRAYEINATLKVWGIGTEDAMTQARRATFPPRVAYFQMKVPNENVVPMFRKGHAVLAMYDPARRQNRESFPNKVYEAMAAGRPVIVSEGTKAAEFVEREEVGMAVPYTEDGFQWAVDFLRDNPQEQVKMGIRGNELTRTKYNWETESQRLLQVYRWLE